MSDPPPGEGFWDGKGTGNNVPVDLKRPFFHYCEEIVSPSIHYTEPGRTNFH
jgi:hypothetical protein